MKSAKYWIEHLEMEKHPEGGYFKEMYRANEMISGNGLPARYQGENRSFSTSIYFLLKGPEFSAFHRLQSDEIWHFYEGTPVVLYLLFENGELFKQVMGPEYDQGMVYQLVLPKTCWFAAHVLHPEGHTLVGCTVAPGFDFKDFELAERDKLMEKFPQHQKIIHKLTKP